MRVENRSLAAPLGGLLALCATCAALLLALFPPSARAVGCPNETIRAEQGSAALALPDCRAYELTSPGSIPSLTGEGKVEVGGGKASPEGDALSYVSRYPATSSQTSSETWLSRRTADGWTITSLDPQMTPAPTSVGICDPGVALSDDLDAYLLSAGGDIYSSKSPIRNGECGLPAEELVPGEPRGFSNLYLRREGDPYVLVNQVPAEESPANATYQAASADLSRVVFSENALLTPESPPGFNLFVWVEGVVRLAGVLPNGEPIPAQLGAATENWGEGSGGHTMGLAPVSHAVSADGDRIYFEANGSLYLRLNSTEAQSAISGTKVDGSQCTESTKACTVQIDRKQGGLDESGGGVFQFASRDGSKAFFLSDHRLTPTSSAAIGKPDLYEYNVGTKKLVDLTVASGEAANVRGFSGGSDDGSHLYFVARGVLTGSEQNREGEEAQAGQPNLYLAHEGKATYVVTLSPWKTTLEGQLGGMDQHNWWETGRLKTAWSPSGRYLLFSSHKSLTGFNNTPAGPGLCEAKPACEELFLYDAEAGELSCVSCDPGGAKPVANTRLVERQEAKRFLPGPRYAPRVALDSGQVFFETENSLSPQDVNGSQDVYQYHAGDLRLISSGTAEGDSGFIDASADGANAFFVTPEDLVGADEDGGLLSVYDARIDGGFAEPPSPPPPCDGSDSCRSSGPFPPPPVASPSTPNFAGEGNLRPRRCNRGRVLRGDRCVKKKHKHRKQRSGQRRSGGKG